MFHRHRKFMKFSRNKDECMEKQPGWRVVLTCRVVCIISINSSSPVTTSNSSSFVSPCLRLSISLYHCLCIFLSKKMFLKYLLKTPAGLAFGLAVKSNIKTFKYMILISGFGFWLQLPAEAVSERWQ